MTADDFERGGRPAAACGRLRRRLVAAACLSAAGGAARAQPAAAAQPQVPAAASNSAPTTASTSTSTSPGALPPEVASELGPARLRGSGTLRFLGLRIYDARLWSAETPTADSWAAVPFALELVYARSLQGERIAERSLTEMQRQGEPPPTVAARWLASMKQLFPDVREGDRLTGLHRPGGDVKFFFNGTLRSGSADADFARPFFGIWLSPQTSEPALRSALLGLTGR